MVSECPGGPYTHSVVHLDPLFNQVIFFKIFSSCMEPGKFWAGRNSFRSIPDNTEWLSIEGSSNAVAFPSLLLNVVTGVLNFSTIWVKPWTHTIGEADVARNTFTQICLCRCDISWTVSPISQSPCV